MSYQKPPPSVTLKRKQTQFHPRSRLRKQEKKYSTENVKKSLLLLKRASAKVRLLRLHLKEFVSTKTLLMNNYLPKKTITAGHTLENLVGSIKKN